VALAAIVVSVAAAALGVTVLVARDGDAPSANSGLRWRADFETGDFSQYAGVFEASPARASVVTSPRKQGDYAARIEVRAGERTGAQAGTNRTELIGASGTNTYSVTEGSELWHMWWFYAPSSTTWKPMVMMQHANSLRGGGVELTGLMTFNASGRLEYQDNGSRKDGLEYFWRTQAPVTRGVWHKVLLRKRWSSREAAGFVEIWYDDVQQVLRTDSAGARGRRTYHRNLNNARTGVRMHQGIYRNDPGGDHVAVIYLDGLRVGTTRDAVEH
jgi:hypothetical protein